MPETFPHMRAYCRKTGREIRFFDITIKGETRSVECYCVYDDDGERFDSLGAPGLYQKRSGTKLWPGELTLWRQHDGSYKLMLTKTILNRAGYRLVGWNGEFREGAYSQHNSAMHREGAGGEAVS